MALLMFDTKHSTLEHFLVRHNEAKRSIPPSETFTERDTLVSYIALLLRHQRWSSNLVFLLLYGVVVHEFHAYIHLHDWLAF